MAAPFRSELEAIRGRAEALEEQNEELREQLERVQRRTPARPALQAPVHHNPELATLAERTLERLDHLSQEIDAEMTAKPEAAVAESAVRTGDAPALVHAPAASEITRYRLEADAARAAERLDHQHTREIAGLQVRIRGLERAGRRWLAAALAVGVAIGVLLGRLWR